MSKSPPHSYNEHLYIHVPDNKGAYKQEYNVHSLQFRVLLMPQILFFCHSLLPVQYKGASRSLSPAALKKPRGISGFPEKNPAGLLHAPADHLQRSSRRPSELHHCPGQRGGSVQHQLLWKNGHGRLRFLLKSGGLRFSPRDLLCPVHDHLHQPEYRCEEI